MSRTSFLLSEAQISLFLADANLLPVGASIWFGGFATRLKLPYELEEVVLSGSGDAYPTARHTGESHLISLGQTWRIFKDTMADFKPARNQTYVLSLVWTEKGAWMRRIYYGVTWRSQVLDAPNTNYFNEEQNLRAQYYQQDSGALALGTGSQPSAQLPSPSAGTQQPVGFFRENPLIAGEYLLGFYTWPTPVTLVSASVIAWAPQVAPTVLGLEINGVLTGPTLVIPVGAANVEVTASTTLTGIVPANAIVRWKVVSGPDPADAAWSCAVSMLISG